MGGFRTRSKESLHGMLHHDIYFHGKDGMSFASKDLKQAFDSTFVIQCVLILWMFGASLNICRLVVGFYMLLKNSFSIQQIFSSSWCSSKAKLMQECPLSMALIALPMAI